MNEVTEKYDIPLEAVLGGPETMYPDFRRFPFRPAPPTRLGSTASAQDPAVFRREADALTAPSNAGTRRACGYRCCDVLLSDLRPLGLTGR
jgi:hypothetical protein